MELVRSNQTENLARALATRVAEQPLGPFAKEAIVVQSRGMERWLTLELAKALGIWGNPFFPFPRTIIEQILEDVSGGASEQAMAYDPQRLKWTVAELLRESAPAELRAYLGKPTDADRALRLASSVSTMFDRYVVHRAPMLRRWAAGEERHWQADLWRRVAEQLGPHDLATRAGRALQTLRSSSHANPIRYERLHLFSLETLPPLFLELFSEVSRVVPTVLYLLEPSSEYVSDVDRAPQLSLPIEDVQHDGHPLLIRLGSLARDFQDLLLGMSEVVQSESDLFELPERRDLLSSLQADIVEFRAPPEENARTEVHPADESIAIHACTGPMREVQVLHDQIRAALEDDSTLRPEDVVVMTPDLDTYAPLFRAVLGQQGTGQIPYEVHDRRTRDDAPFFDDFFSALEVIDSRFSVLDVLRLIDAGSLRADYVFNPEERARLAELLEEVGVRWGVDGAHREELGFPDEPIHTWRAGFERLFLGFSNMPDATEVFEGFLPRGAPTLNDASLVARLAELCEVLFDFRSQARKSMPIDCWAALLGRLSSALFAQDEERSSAVHVLRSALGELKAAGGDDGFAGAVSLATMRRELAALLRLNTPAVGFLRRGVTLTELVPLRSVPFRVVCLLGMSEESFPRGDDRPSFDQTRLHHQAGDRNKRDDDRHSFLQAILCARDRLIILYSAPATSLRSSPSASPVVWELGESVARFYRRPEGTHPLEATVHPVHAFDSRYFEGGALPRSSSARHLEIAKAIAEPPREPARIELLADVETDAASETLTTNELSKWLWNPAREFIRRVLRAKFETSTLYEPTHALIELTPLSAARVGGVALDAALRHQALADYLRAAPEFPDGTAGKLKRLELAREIEVVDRTRATVSDEPTSDSRWLSVQVGDARLEGRLGGLGDERRVVTRFTKPRRRTELQSWIEHLVLLAAGGSNATTELVLRGDETKAARVCFGEPADPRQALEELVALYRASRERPLPLFERASWTYAEAYAAGGMEKAAKAASGELRNQRKWDPHLDYVVGPNDPFADPAWSEAFGDAALRVYGRLLEHRSEQ